MDVSENSDAPKSSLLLGFSITNHPFWGTPIFGNLHIVFQGVFPLCFPSVPLEPPNEAALRARVSSRFACGAGVNFGGLLTGNYLILWNFFKADIVLHAAFLVFPIEIGLYTQSLCECLKGSFFWRLMVF